MRYSILATSATSTRKHGGAFKQESGNKDHTEFYRLYDRRAELREKIDGFLREARLESEKNAGPSTSKKDRPDWKE